MPPPLRLWRGVPPSVVAVALQLQQVPTGGQQQVSGADMSALGTMPGEAPGMSNVMSVLQDGIIIPDMRRELLRTPTMRHRLHCLGSHPYVLSDHDTPVCRQDVQYRQVGPRDDDIRLLLRGVGEQQPPNLVIEILRYWEPKDARRRLWAG